MHTSSSELINLEHRFWQSMVDGDTDTALHLLAEPSMMVSAQGAMQFDHAAYREMAEHGDQVVRSFQLTDMNVMFPDDDTAVLTYHASQAVAPRGAGEAVQQEMADSSVWLRRNGQWRCVMHTETPIDSSPH